MSELISVDFKSRTVTARVDLDKPAEPVPEWSAAKDPDFKVFVEAVAAVAEMVHKEGGDWRRMIFVMQNRYEDKEETCYTLYDRNTITNAEASDALMLAASKIDYSEAESQEVEPDAAT